MQTEKDLRDAAAKQPLKADPPKSKVDLETAPAGTSVEEHTPTAAAPPREIPPDVLKAQQEERERQLKGRGMDKDHPSAISRMNPPPAPEPAKAPEKKD
jgi:hypothetical protein